MTAAATTRVTFNLWTEPWIEVARLDGDIETLGIEGCLRRAHELAGFADASPLVAASQQRLLAAIVQELTGNPGSIGDLSAVLRRGQFDTAKIERFQAEFEDRFDLFDETRPFLQSGDIGLAPAKGYSTKPLGYLFPEEPTATNINHFFHRYDDEFQLSPASAAAGLVTLAAFATSGGAGIKPSINGVPPLYVLPVGVTLFETLVLSIVTPGYQPEIAVEEDRPAWRREAVVAKGSERAEVGYLESLTFPARRVRLFPEPVGGIDARTGVWSEVIVRRMVFEQGLSRPKGSAAWLDPFTAYRVRDEGPVPIRPQEGKTLWREYGNLFQTAGASGERDLTAGTVIPPAVVEQVAELQDAGALNTIALKFRCVGMRTDMKAKVFEWVDETFGVPPSLLNDAAGQLMVRVAIERAEEWGRTVAAIQRARYPEHEVERQRMLAGYWTALAGTFRELVNRVAGADETQNELALKDWAERLFETGETVLARATREAGDRGELLRRRSEALDDYRKARGRKAKEWVG